MRKFGVLVLSMLLSLTVFGACSKKASFSPTSPQSEYARIYPNGQAFDFDKVKVFTRKSTISLTGDAFESIKNVHGDPYYPTLETEEYKYENVHGTVHSQRTIRQVESFIKSEPTPNRPLNSPKYAPYTREIYAAETLYYADMHGDGTQLNTPVTPEKTYASREEYLADTWRCFDTPMQRIVPYDLAFFSSFTGKKEGNRYRMTGIVDVEGHGEAFFDAFTANYAFKTWYTGSDNNKVCAYFLDGREFTSDDTHIRVEIVSNRNGLCSVTEIFETRAAYRPLPSFVGTAIRLTCTTEYSTAAFTEAIVIPPIAA